MSVERYNGIRLNTFNSKEMIFKRQSISNQLYLWFVPNVVLIQKNTIKKNLFH